MDEFIVSCAGSYGRITLFDISEPVGEHVHPQANLLFKVAGADRSMQIGSNPVVLSDGACVTVNPWEAHRDTPVSDAGTTRMLALYVDLDWISQRIGYPPQTALPHSVPLSPDMQRCVMQISEALVDDTLGSGLEDVVADFAEAVLHPAKQLTRTNRAADYRIRNAARLLGHTPHLHPDMTTVARSVGLSRSRFYQQFRNALGLAPHLYVDGLVLERAITLLAGSDARLEEISALLGFSAQSSFTRFFKERVGFPPSVIRHAARRLQ